MKSDAVSLCVRCTALVSLFVVGLSMTVAAKEDPAEIMRNLPVTIEGFDTEPLYVYPDKEGGVSVGYNDRAERAAVTVYLYDEGFETIPDGPDAPGFLEIEKGIVENYLKMQRDGEIKDFAIQSGGKVSLTLPDGREAAFRHMRLAIESASDQPDTLSDVYLTGARDHILKIRITRIAPPMKELEARIERLVMRVYETIKGGGLGDAERAR